MPTSTQETQVEIAGRVLPLSVVGSLYQSIRESLDVETSRDATALWNSMIRAQKQAVGIKLARYVGPTISAARLDALLAAQAQKAAA